MNQTYSNPWEAATEILADQLQEQPEALNPNINVVCKSERVYSSSELLFAGAEDENN